jgi:transposase InsO family protein
MIEIELPKVPEEVSAEALFRHRTVAAVLGLVALGRKRPEAIMLVAQSTHVTVTGQVRSVSPRTLYRWLGDYERGGIAALEPRLRVVKSTALPDELIAYLSEQKTKDSDASVPEILRRATQKGLVAPGVRVHRATAWRAVKRLGLATTCRAAKALTDMRRFAYSHRMRMVLVDGKHFRAGKARLKRVAFFFIDDCTRRVLWVVVGASENSRLLLRGLYQVIRHFGLMDILYFDRGPGFIADDTHAVCVRLNICFIHGRAKYPEGHGKVEAFNKTAHHAVLRGLARADVDPDFGSLELRLHHYIEHQYNMGPHESLGGHSPAERWNADERELTFPADHDDLRRRFVLTESRRVTADNIVSVDGTHYELPIGHARKSIAVQRHLLTGAAFIVHDRELVQLHPVDLARNAEDKRARRPPPDDDSREAPVTAAAMAFERDFGPASITPAAGQSARSRKSRKQSP